MSSPVGNSVPPPRALVHGGWELVPPPHALVHKRGEPSRFALCNGALGGEPVPPLSAKVHKAGERTASG